MSFQIVWGVWKVYERNGERESRIDRLRFEERVGALEVLECISSIGAWKRRRDEHGGQGCCREGEACGMKV